MAQITGISLSQFQVNLRTEGIYFLTANVTDGQGLAYTDTIAITALNLTDLDTLLQWKWDVQRPGSGLALQHPPCSAAGRSFHIQAGMEACP
jgi:hypothetical protein